MRAHQLQVVRDVKALLKRTALKPVEAGVTRALHLHEPAVHSLWQGAERRGKPSSQLTWIAPGASAHLLNLTLMPNELWLFLERGLNGIARVADICNTYIPEMSILLPTPAGGTLRREHWSFTQLRPEMGERAQSLKALLMSPRTAMGSNPRNSEAPSRTPSIVPDAEHGRWLWAESSNVKARKQHRYRWGWAICFRLGIPARAHSSCGLRAPRNRVRAPCEASPWPRSSGPPWGHSARLAARHIASVTTRVDLAATACAMTRVQVRVALRHSCSKRKPKGLCT